MQGGGSPSLVLQVNGDVSVKTDSAQIDGVQDVTVEAKDANVQAGQASVSTQGDMPVQVAGDLKADKTHVTMQTQAAPRTISVQRDKSGRIVGAQVNDQPTGEGTSNEQ
jgi:hypothetical protein